MAVLGKAVCYINSSGITLMRWVKTLKEEKTITLRPLVLHNNHHLKTKQKTPTQDLSQHGVSTKALGEYILNTWRVRGSLPAPICSNGGPLSNLSQREGNTSCSLSGCGLCFPSFHSQRCLKSCPKISNAPSLLQRPRKEERLPYLHGRSSIRDFPKVT